MIVIRPWLALGLALLVPASIAGTAGYGCYLRSDLYRRRVESDVSGWLGMPVTIGGVRPHDWGTLTVRDISAALEPGGPEVFHCRRALWREASTAPGGGGQLDLEGGWILVGTHAWGRTEYGKLVRGGLSHDFESILLESVRLHDFDLRWVMPEFEVRAGGAEGVIRFDSNGGHAVLSCGRINGAAPVEQIRLGAQFRPGPRPAFDRVVLTLPEVTLADLDLDVLLGGAIRSGRFAGTVTLEDVDTPGATPRATVSGFFRDADLSELTRRLDGGPYHGTAEIEARRIVIVGGALSELDVSGRLEGLRIAELLPFLASSAAEGDPADAPRDEGRSDSLTIDIKRALWRDGRIESADVRGALRCLPLAPLLARLGLGSLDGDAEVGLDAVTVRNDRIIFADARIDVRPPPPATHGRIDRPLLVWAGRQLLNVNLEPVLPPHVEYARLGGRVVLRDDQLRIEGNHGPDGRTILTVRLLGRDVGILRQPTGTFPAPDLLALLRERAGQITGDDLRQWWDVSRTGASSP